MPSAAENGQAIAAVQAENEPRASSHLCARLLRKHPTFTAAALFLLILSGPPRFRLRDAEASLRGEIDWVVIVHAVVWAAAGLWVALQLGKRFFAGRRLLRIHLPQILGFALILGLGASTLKSAAPALTAFKVYQMLVCLLFTQLFVERFGARAALKTMLWGNTILCITISVCAFLAPDMVWARSDINPDASRLFGQLIAPPGVVAVLAMILVLTTVRRIWKPLPLLLFGLFLSLIVFSLMRTAYVAALAFFVLVLVKRPNIKPLRRVALALCLILLMLSAAGWLPSVNRYRDPESISTLSDRTGLWRHLASVTLSESPWLGLGYYSASRVYALEYNPWLGTAHSILVEALAGGGVPSFVLLSGLCLVLLAYSARLLWSANDRLSFAIAALFIASLIFGLMGDEIDSGPVAVSFWCAAAILPRLRPWLVSQTARSRAYSVATVGGTV